jgi:hypothetical protein
MSLVYGLHFMPKLAILGDVMSCSSVELYGEVFHLMHWRLHLTLKKHGILKIHKYGIATVISFLY